MLDSMLRLNLTYPLVKSVDCVQGHDQHHIPVPPTTVHHLPQTSNRIHIGSMRSKAKLIVGYTSGGVQMTLQAQDSLEEFSRFIQETN